MKVTNTFYKINNDDPNLKVAVQDLLKLVLTKKQFRFDINEIQTNHELLLENNVLLLKDTKLEISFSAMFYNELLLHFSPIFSFKLTNEISLTFAFVENVQIALKSDLNVNYGIAQFFKNFRSFLLHYTNTELKEDFSQFIQTLSKESEQLLYDFNSAYCNILPYLKIDENLIFSNANHLMKVLQSDVMFNANIGIVGKSLKEYCILNIESGKKLLAYSLSAENNSNVVTPVLAGIYDSERELMWEELMSLQKQDDNTVSLLLAFSSIGVLNNTEAKWQFEFINSLNHESDIAKINLPRFYVSLINDKNLTDIELKKKCFTKIGDLIISTNQNVRNFVLREMQFIDETSLNTIDVIIKLFRTPDFDHSTMQNIGRIFSSYQHLESFLELLKAYVVIFKKPCDLDNFKPTLDYFNTNFKESFSEQIIKLITNNSGGFRNLGHRIIDCIKPHRGKFSFASDLLKLNSITQIKIIVSVFNEVKEPKNSIPLVSPLLKSPYQKIVDTLTWKLELMTEDYGKAVINVLTSELDLTIPANENLINRITKYRIDFYQKIDEKNKIKEFDPVNTHSKYYRLFFENYGKSFNKYAAESHKGKSMFNQLGVKTVILSKGGGWKTNGKDSVSKLGKIEVSFLIPRTSFINPEFYDWEFRTRYIENWENKFKEWEAIT